MLRRCYGILKRAGVFPPQPPDVEDIIESADIDITSNLALIQKAITAQPLQNFLSTVAGLAQFDPSVRFKVDTFKAVDEAADIYGAPESILIGSDDARMAAQQEAQAAEKQKQEERNALLQSTQAQTAAAQSQAAKNYSDAGAGLQEALGSINPAEGYL